MPKAVCCAVQGFLTADSGKAQQFFNLATEQFDEALQQDPSNEVYRKALEMTKKAPELHAELQRQLAAQGEVLSFTSPELTWQCTGVPEYQ